jgi:hypothetical protein
MTVIQCLTIESHMWVKRSHEDLVRAERRRKFGGVIFVLAFAAFFSIFGMFKTTWWETVETGRVLVPSEERLSRLPNLFLSGVIIGILCMLIAPKPEVVCPKCGKIERKGRFTRCQCGGYYENLRDMKWIDKKG